MNPNLKEVTKEDPDIVCLFCHSSKIKPLEWGPLYQLDGITAHHFCFLFSAGLSQNGDDDKDGILQFLPDDIRVELMRGKKLKCMFCRKRNATIGCREKTCRATYHFPCGLAMGFAFYFIDNYESSCSEHMTQLPLASIPEAGTTCAICCGELTDGSDDQPPLSPPCCNKDVFFHKRCIMNMGRNHGLHYFKCPLCNNGDDFSKAMRMAGVYLPDKDATWEEEPNAFVELNQRYNQCDAQNCLCPDGRIHYSQTANSPWSIVRCGGCGSSGIHIKCGGLQTLAWRCGTCAVVLSGKGRNGRVIVSEQDDSFECSDEEEGEGGIKFEASTDLGESVDHGIDGETLQHIEEQPEREHLSTAQQRSVVSVVGDEEDQQDCVVGKDNCQAEEFETGAGPSTDYDNFFRQDQSNENNARTETKDEVDFVESTVAVMQPVIKEEEGHFLSEDPPELETETVIPIVNRLPHLAPPTNDLSEDGSRPRRSQRLSQKTANERKIQTSSTQVNGPLLEADRKTLTRRRLPPPEKVVDKENTGRCSPIQITRGSNKNKFKCLRCSKIFKYRSSTIQHMFVHSNERCFRCPQCPKSFTRHDSVNRHMRTHSGVKPHQCPECERSFAYGWYLETHLRRHAKTRPFRCTVSKCGMRFVSSSELRNHNYTHTNRRPFKCSLCEKDYKECKSLSRHFKRSH